MGVNGIIRSTKISITGHWADSFILVPIKAVVIEGILD
jgi:hypothetical protein